MTSESEMGRLERVELRNMWKSEPGDFTPWLANEDNIKLLGDAIGVDLEVEAQEKNVGLYRADILCKDTATGQWVLIENQLERTDHHHLGQLMTYAAGLDAVTIVWISPQFTEGHRAALDWLNEKVAEEIRFFGVEIELWRIGSSPTAPKFNIVSKPNDWTKPSGELRSRFTTELTDRKKFQLEYWQEFRKFMEDKGGSVRPTKPLPQYWQAFSIGRTGFLLYAVVNVKSGRIGVQLIIQGIDAKAHYSAIAEQREEIEEEAGEKLEWRKLPDKKESQINIWYECHPADQLARERQHKWLFEKLQIFHKTFGERIKAIRTPVN